MKQSTLSVSVESDSLTPHSQSGSDSFLGNVQVCSVFLHYTLQPLDGAWSPADQSDITHVLCGGK